MMIKRLQEAVTGGGNVFAVLMDAVRVLSLGQITRAGGNGPAPGGACREASGGQSRKESVIASEAKQSTRPLDCFRAIPSRNDAGSKAVKRPAVYIMANKRNGTLYTGVTSDLGRCVRKSSDGMETQACAGPAPSLRPRASATREAIHAPHWIASSGGALLAMTRRIEHARRIA